MHKSLGNQSTASSFFLLLSALLLLLTISSSSVSSQASTNFNIKEINPFPNDVHGLAINPMDSALYFTTLYGGHLCKLEYPYTDNYSLTSITGQRLSGLLWLNQRLFIADLSEGEIKEYDPNLNLISMHKVPNPWNMTTDGQSIYIVTFSGELYKLFNNQVFLLTSGLAYPFDIEYSPDHTLYISEQIGSNSFGRISEFNLNGDLLHILPNIFDTPLGITFDQQGNLFALDNNTNYIYCIAPDGTTNLVSSSYDNPIAIIPNLDNNLFISSAKTGGTLLEVSTQQATNLQELEVSNLVLFPNPATNQLSITMELEHQADPEVTIISYAGQKVQITELDQQQHKGKLELLINTEHLFPGNYFINIGDSKFNVVRQFSISK